MCSKKKLKGLKKKYYQIKSKPCSYWTLLSAKKSKCLTDVVLSTDSKK